MTNIKRIAAGMLAAATLLAPVRAGEIRPVDWIVAVVDAEIITFTQFVEEMRVEAARRGATLEQLSPEQKSALVDGVMEKLLTDALFVQEARRSGVTATPAEIEREAEQAMERLKKQFVDENTFERALAAEFTTPDRIHERYRAQAEAQILRNKYIEQEIKTKIKITDSDVMNAYHNRGEEINIRHILVAEEAVAESVRERLAAGEDFTTVSSSVTTLEAADLGWIRRGSLVEAFENAAFALSKGQTSQVVKTRYGYHVIQLLDRRAAELPELTDDLKERIFGELYSTKFDSMFEKLLTSIRERAYVEIRESALESLN